MTLGRSHLPGQVLDANGLLLVDDGASLHAEDARVWASDGLNYQAISRLMLRISILPWHYWLISILVTLLGNSFISVGFIIQKRAHRDDKDERFKRWYFLSSTWLFGLSVCIVGHGCCWIGLALGTQTVLSCLNCWTMVLSCMFAPCMLGETLSSWKILAVAMLVIGCALVVSNGSRHYEMLTKEKLHDHLTSSLFLGLCCASWLTALFLGRQVERPSPKLIVFKYCFYSAIGGWHAVLMSKAISGLLLTSWHNQDEQYKCLEFWICPILFIGFSGWNLHFLNMALAQGEAVSVIPLYEALSLVGQVILGGVFFGEFHELDVARMVRFCVGVCCVLCGIMLVYFQPPEISGSEECTSLESAQNHLDEIPEDAKLMA